MSKCLSAVVLLGALGTSAYLISAQSSRASATPTTPSADFLAAALRDQEQSCGESLQVVYTGEWRKVGSDALDDHEVATYTYSRTPEGLRVDKVKEDGSRDSQSFDRASGEYRRLLATGHDAGSGEVAQGLMACFSTPEFFDPVRYPLHEGPLCQGVASGTVSDKAETIDGHTCWRVDIPTQKSGIDKYVAWLDPDVGFCPRRITFMWKSMQPEIVEFSDYVDEGGGVWFPMKQTVSYGSTTIKDATFSIVNKVTKVATGKPMAKSDVVLQFPSGTPVHDALHDADYVVP